MTTPKAPQPDFVLHEVTITRTYVVTVVAPPDVSADTVEHAFQQHWEDDAERPWPYPPTGIATDDLFPFYGCGDVENTTNLVDVGPGDPFRVPPSDVLGAASEAGLAPATFKCKLKRFLDTMDADRTRFASIAKKLSK